MATPTHDELCRAAYRLRRERGCLDGSTEVDGGQPMRLILAVILAVTCAACATKHNAWTTTWTSFTRTSTTNETRDRDWQECHDRYVNKYSYLVTGWFAAETASHQPQIRACMEGKGYALKDRQ